MKYLLIPIFLFFVSTNIYTQRTVGVLSSTDEVSPGYVFFSNSPGTNAYMVDQCGRLINQWNRGTSPGLAAYFLDNGLMFRTYKTSVLGPFTSASNGGGLELVNWDNETVWHYEFNTPESLSHHDAVMMPNGNIMVLIWELVFTPELIEQGRDPNNIPSNGLMWTEKIIEISPVGENDIEIVWEWEIKDHLIQDFDDTKSNFGVISDHPELIDINFGGINFVNGGSNVDWYHTNSIDYNEDLDQILLSSRGFNEIWIIDHSTSTEEASTHSGGIYGKGGDILYRWGHTNTYLPNGELKLFGQHGANWIDKGLKDEGKILIFNNGNGRPDPGFPFSTVEILTPPQSTPGFYDYIPAEGFGPETQEWIYKKEDYFYSPFLSNAQRIENGHTFINAGSDGYLIEINEQDEVVWEYVVPVTTNTPIFQGANANNNATFRAYKISNDLPFFDSVDVVPGEVIEVDNNPLPCLISSNEEILVDPVGFSFIHYRDSGQLEILNPKNKELKFYMFDVYGKLINEKAINQTQQYIDLDFQDGIYFVELIDNQQRRKSGKIILFE